MSWASACLNFSHFQPQMCLYFFNFQPQMCLAMCLFSKRNLCYRYNYFYLKNSDINLYWTSEKDIILTANIMVLIKNSQKWHFINKKMGKIEFLRKKEKKKEKRSKFWPNLSLGACLAIYLFFEETEPSVLMRTYPPPNPFFPASVNV